MEARKRSSESLITAYYYEKSRVAENPEIDQFTDEDNPSDR